MLLLCFPKDFSAQFRCLSVKSLLTIHGMQVSVLLEAAIVFIFFSTNVTRVPKIVCRKKKTDQFRKSEVKGKHCNHTAQSDTPMH